MYSYFMCRTQRPTASSLDARLRETWAYGMDLAGSQYLDLRTRSLRL
jgi:hypothetical protein